MTDEQFYHSARYKRWRRKVLERAGYLGEPIRATVAHHIKHRDEYPELELEVSNGRALCAKCHNLEHPEKGGARR